MTATEKEQLRERVHRAICPSPGCTGHGAVIDKILAIFEELTEDE